MFTINPLATFSDRGETQKARFLVGVDKTKNDLHGITDRPLGEVRLKTALPLMQKRGSGREESKTPDYGWKETPMAYTMRESV
jgi:hypothetical protein